MVFYYRGNNEIMPTRWLSRATLNTITHYLGPFQSVSTFYGANGVIVNKVAWDLKAHASWLVSSVLPIVYLNIDASDKDNCGAEGFPERLF